MAEMLTIEIDGVPCTCEKGEYLYDVAKRNGIRIPALCRSGAFEDHRACCRICIVEVETRGRTKVVTSCVYPVEQECIVRTKTDRIREERAVLMALLERRAPDSGYMYDMAEKLGAHDDAGFARLTALDAGKCILCGLCVQACNALGTGAISTVMRGTDKKVSTPYDTEALACVGCLSCANVCPTGEITYTQDADQRTIWNKTFDLVKCHSCGAIMGTPESIAWSQRNETVSVPAVCAACRRRVIADSMRDTYRNV